MFNVGAPVSNECTILQLIFSLFDACATISSQIRHSEILPPFYKARFMVILEERTLVKRTQNNTDHQSRRITMSTLLLTPAETNKTPPAVATDAVAKATIMADELVVMVVVKPNDHWIIEMGHWISLRHILLMLHSGSRGPLLLALILPLEVGSS